MLKNNTKNFKYQKNASKLGETQINPNLALCLIYNHYRFENASGKIMDEGMASFIQCPGTDCNILVEDDLVLGLITSEKRCSFFEKNIQKLIS